MHFVENGRFEELKYDKLMMDGLKTISSAKIDPGFGARFIISIKIKVSSCTGRKRKRCVEIDQVPTMASSFSYGYIVMMDLSARIKFLSSLNLSPR